MHNFLPPTLILVVLPLLVAARSAYLQGRTQLAWAAVLASVLATVVALPVGGLEFVFIKRMNLFLAAGTAAILLARHRRLAGLERPGRRLAVLAVVTTLSVINFFNYFDFHGERTFVHAHDIGHYYLGSKYFKELGYTGLYTAMLRVEAELYDDHFKAIEARDLETNELVHIRPLLEKSGAVKAKFSPERWYEFGRDVVFFRDRLGPHYGTFLKDHGYNPTPLWSLMGGALTNLVPAGNATGVLLLSLMDPLLLVATAALVAWAFGLEAALLATIAFCVTFGATFGWVGGAFLRYTWFFGVVGSVCAMARGYAATAGALLAGATMLRIFPAALMVAPGFQVVGALLRRAPVPRHALVLIASFTLTAAMLLTTTAALPEGLSHWNDFRENISKHHDNVAPNLVGLSVALTYKPGPPKLTREEFMAVKARRTSIHRWQLATIGILVLITVAGLSATAGPVESLLLGVPLLFFGLNLAAYYWALLVLLVIVEVDRPRRAAAVFACEAATYALFLFERADGLVFVYRSVLIFYLLAYLYAEPIGAALQAFRTPREV